MLRTAAVDYEADPMLLHSCPKSIDKCKASVDLTAGKAQEDGGRIEGIALENHTKITDMYDHLSCLPCFQNA